MSISRCAVATRLTLAVRIADLIAAAPDVKFSIAGTRP